VRKRMLIVALAVAVGATFVGFTTGTAKAAGNDTTVTTTAVSIGPQTVTVGGVSVAAADIASAKVTILSYVKAKGLSKKQKSHAKKMVIGAGTSVPCYWNSGVGVNGARYWFRDCRRITVYLIHGQWRKGPCGNFIRFSHPPSHVVTGRVILVRSFAHVKVWLHAHIGVSITEPCGSATVSGSAESEASVQIYLRVFVKAQGSVTADVFAKIVAHIEQEVQVTIVCNAGPPPQGCTVISVTTINDVDTGGGSPNFKVRASCPGSDTGELSVTAQYGSFDPSGLVDFTGTQEFSYTYWAPSEQPSGGQDTITVFLTDKTTGVSTQYSESFPINPPPPDH